MEDTKHKDEPGTESATTLTPEELEAARLAALPLDERVALFNIELKPTLKKYALALVAEPRIQNGLIVADPKLADQNDLLKSTESASKVEQVA